MAVFKEVKSKAKGVDVALANDMLTHALLDKGQE
jgi:hypothetical protein